MKQTRNPILIAAAAFALGGCAGDPGTPQTTMSSGMALTADIYGDTDVAGVRFDLVRVPCDEDDTDFEPYSATYVTDLEDSTLPGMIPEFDGRPFDSHSRHLYADMLAVVPAGCYDVTATPIDSEGNDSADCAPAHAYGVRAEDGLTVETLLVSQCDGDPTTIIDEPVALNHPPELTGLALTPSKFVFECEYVELCVTVTDPDRDPVEIAWEQVAGPPVFAGPTVISHDEDGGTVTECVEFAASLTGDYLFRVTAYDLFWQGGEPIRVEDYLAAQGDPAPSRDTLEFPLYVNWDIELECIDAETGEMCRYPGVREIERAAGCDWFEPAEYFCTYEPDTTCPGGVFDPYSVYPMCDEPCPPEESFASAP